MIFEGNGDLWFTVQRGNFVGKLWTYTGSVELIAVPTARARPYDIVVDGGGGTVRHMYYHPPSHEILFGTDTNTTSAEHASRSVSRYHHRVNARVSTTDTSSHDVS